jgi:hypothetical protein
VKAVVTYCAFLIAFTGAALQAQVIDTTQRINTWMLMHDYSRFEDVTLDTTAFGLHTRFNPMFRNGTFYEHVGILSHAARNIDFFSRPQINHFLFGASLNPYLDNPDRTIFFNTRTPYSEIVYSNIIGVQWNEETVNFLHTQNMDPYTNIGIDFEILSGKELYVNEESRMTKITLFGSRARDDYSAFGTFHYNNSNNRENGGLKDIREFTRDTIGQDPFFYDVQLENASSGFRNLNLFYTQKYMLLEKVRHTDTLGNTTVTGRNVALSHQLKAERNTRFYTDDSDSATVADYYGNRYYMTNEVMDSVVEDRISNTFQVILGDPYTDKLSARIYAGHEFTRYGQLSPENNQYFSRFDTLSQDPLQLDSVFRDTTWAVFNRQSFNELFVGFHMAGPPESKWYWYVDGKYYLAGYYRNNFTANATFARTISDALRLGLRGGIRNRNVSYYHNRYSSAYFQWNNDFNPSQFIHGEAFITSANGFLDVNVTTGLLTNYLYWDEQALPAQYDQPIYIASGKLKSHVAAGGFHTVNQLLVQYSTADQVLNLPLAALRTSNFYKRAFFDSALIAELGFDLQITTQYYASAYMPATGQFHLQNDRLIGGYPFLDVFLAIRIKRTRIFGSLNNSLSPLMGRKYFSTYGYPGKPLYFRFGLAWTFYN